MSASPVTNGTECATGEYLKLMADIAREDETPASHRSGSVQAATSATDREVAEMAEFIVGLAHEPATDGLIRRAVRNVYNLGRLHETQDQVQRNIQLQQQMLQQAAS